MYPVFLSTLTELQDNKGRDSKFRSVDVNQEDLIRRGFLKINGFIRLVKVEEHS